MAVNSLRPQMGTMARGFNLFCRPSLLMRHRRIDRLDIDPGAGECDRNRKALCTKTGTWWPPNQNAGGRRPDAEISATTVSELRKVIVWPENLAITTPQEHYPESVVRVNKATIATRTSPKR
jgi:hypothetical protein